MPRQSGCDSGRQPHTSREGLCGPVPKAEGFRRFLGYRTAAQELKLQRYRQESKARRKVAAAAILASTPAARKITSSPVQGSPPAPAVKEPEVQFDPLDRGPHEQFDHYLERRRHEQAARWQAIKADLRRDGWAERVPSLGYFQ